LNHRLHFNAFTQNVTAPLAFSVGRCLPLAGMSRQQFQTVTTVGHVTMAVVNLGPGYYVGQVGDLTVGSTLATIDTPVMASAGFNTAPSAVSPSQAVLTRGSVRLRNMTKNLDVSSGVTVLNLAAGFDLVPATGFDDLYDFVRSHPKSVTYTGKQLQDGLQFNMHPVNQSKSSDFLPPNVSLAEWKAQVKDPAFSSIVMIFWEDATAQSYEMTIGGTYQARYATTGPLANACVMPPTIPLPLLNALRDGAEAAGSMGYNFLKEAASTAGQFAGAAAARRAIMDAPRLLAIA
jgi:hypothetical protein